MYWRDGIIIIVILIISTTGNAAPAPQDDPALDHETSRRLDSFVQAVMTCRLVPGLSLTLVRGNRSLPRAYGLADVGRGIPATAQTGFPIGSVTKQFTITLLANLLTEHKNRYTWDSKIKDIIGDDFRLMDGIRTDHATIRDLAAHKMGLKLYTLPISVGPDHTHTHLEYCRGFVPAESAGSIYSNAEDMAKWMTFHQKSLAGVPSSIADLAILSASYQPQVAVPSSPAFPIYPPTFPWFEEIFAYNMGWQSGTYRGYRFIEHDGLMTSFGTKLRIFRDVQAGVFVSTNGPMYTAAALARFSIVWFASDLMLGLEPVLNETTACTFPAPWIVTSNSASSSKGDDGNVPEMDQEFGRYEGLQDPALGGDTPLDSKQKINLLKNSESTPEVGNEDKSLFEDLYGFPRQRPVDFRRNEAAAGMRVSRTPSAMGNMCPGQYGHKLFGNLTVNYDERNRTLHLSFGLFGTSYLEPLRVWPPGYMFTGKFYGPLWYLLDTGPFAKADNIVLYGLFFQEQNGLYQQLILQLPLTSIDAPYYFRGVFIGISHIK